LCNIEINPHKILHSWNIIILYRWCVQEISVCCCGWYQVPGNF